jgi:IS5 family transposase
MVTDGSGIPLGTLIDSAQRAEVHLAEPLLNGVRVPRTRGRPRTRPRAVVADKGYDSEDLRRRLRRRGIHPCIPRRRNKRPRRGPNVGNQHKLDTLAVEKKTDLLEVIQAN